MKQYDGNEQNEIPYEDEGLGQLNQYSEIMRLRSALAEKEKECEGLREAVVAAKIKLALYRERVGPSYVGGQEYTSLMKSIDEALEGGEK
jgi:hypothetical protein